MVSAPCNGLTNRLHATMTFLYMLITIIIIHPKFQVWFSNRRAKWRREEKLRNQRRQSGGGSSGGGGGSGGSGGGGGNPAQSPGSLGSVVGSIGSGSSVGSSVGNGVGSVGTVPGSPRIPINSSFNSIGYPSIAQPIASMADTYR